ncbi:alpha/beta fold hydrolase [Cohnella zeiphila]|uniref:Prolyl oligopeptidase family serine peptidase n=1 Tax=Cohnella zeiphila TaxID=2761120 RepID=A0A7X0SK81_9BACL|nr:alpha/beta fold hydrolase [Cohnella zeiphila]MBB6731396.1 prolyl oligopeptidase family serine peptidase [Cohnella zeiphila]
MKPLYGKDALLPEKLRILFLGDSITDDGTYIAFMDAYFRLHAPESRIELINLGVSSETASGLSEPAHPFPRPCVHDRLERALAETRPDWVVVCYGMNDGIYHPLSEERFRAYRDGILRLLGRIRQAGAKAIAMTPPPFDPASLAGGAEKLLPEGLPAYSYETPYADYESVLKRYADWVLSLGEDTADATVGIHGEMLAHIARERAANPAYLSGDGIHPFAPSHWVMAKSLLRTLFNVSLERAPDYVADPDGSASFDLIRSRHRLASAAWKEHVGHTNPNKAEGALPLAEAQAEIEALEARIRELVAGKPELREAVSWSEWEGHERIDFMVDGREGFLILPKEPAAGRPWVWRAEFFDAFAYADRALLAQGWCLAYYRISDMYGCPGAVERMRQFQDYAEEKFDLAKRTVLFGFSRGGLYSFNYAAAHPERVRLLYLDAPVLDIRSWPGGLGAGPGSAFEWSLCLAVYGLTEETARDAKVSPLDQVEPVAAAGIPILIVAGDADEPVPYEENGALLAERYRELGGTIETIVKPGVGHHPHSLSDPAPIVAFVQEHARA